MIALAILSSTIILSLAAIQEARGASLAGAEARRARVEMQYLLDTASPVEGLRSGRAGGFDWRLDTRATGPGSLSGAQICSLTAQLASLSSGRRYRLATTEICAPPPATP